MAKRKAGKQNNFALSIGIVCVVIGVPLIFVLSAVGTNLLSNLAPYVMIGIIVVIIDIYAGMTSTLLWQFYEIDPPWYRWIPCIGELALIDSKFVTPCLILYPIAVVLLLSSLIPYSVLSFLGSAIALNYPVFITMVALVLLTVIQVFKGLGIMNCTKVVASTWEERNHTSAGFIKRFGWLGFIPFVRVVAIYGLNKPLVTLVTFNHETISDNDDVVLHEEEDE